MEWLIEYDITKVDLKNEYVKALLKLIEDARKEDDKNVTQINQHKVRVKISEKVKEDFDDSLKDIKPPEVVEESPLKSFAAKSVAAVTEVIKPKAKQPKTEDTPIVEPTIEVPKPPGLWKRFKTFVSKLFK